MKALKVHKKSIKFIKASPDGAMIAILSIEGDLFLLEQNATDLQRVEPICIFETKLNINSLLWDRNGEKLLIGADDGKIYET